MKMKTKKEEIIEELLGFEEFFHIFALDKENLQYKEEKYLKDCLDDIVRMKNNIERLEKLGINNI